MNKPSETYERGLGVRREVLGAAHVDRSLAAASEFARPLQELVTEYCWGAVWDRPGIDRRTRSMINIAMLSAMNRQHELTVHVKGALTNGVTVDEIREVLIQSAVYAGMPAGLEATRTAEAAILDYQAAEREGA